VSLCLPGYSTLAHLWRLNPWAEAYQMHKTTMIPTAPRGQALFLEGTSRTSVNEERLASNAVTTRRALTLGLNTRLGLALTTTAAHSLQVGYRSMFRLETTSLMDRFSNLTQLLCSSLTRRQLRVISR
jgi:hypothetical protein